MGENWCVPRDWEGETAFVVASGPSRLSQGIERLEGRRVIAVNSSGFDVPFADYLFSGDGRWLNRHRDVLIRDWAGRVVTYSRAADWPGIKRLGKLDPPSVGRRSAVAAATGISTDPRSVVCRWTSLQGAMNVASLYGAARIVLLGADGGPGPIPQSLRGLAWVRKLDAKKGPGADRATHAHAPHPWPQKPDCWDKQLVDLKTAVAPLAALGIEVLNASPGSRLKLWPVTTLDAVLEMETMA